MSITRLLELANQLPEGERPETLIEVYVSYDINPFICGACGYVTLEMLEEIASDIVKDNEMFVGEGTYVFRVTHNPGQYGDEGRREIAPHFELELVQRVPSELRDMVDKREAR